MGDITLYLPVTMERREFFEMVAWSGFETWSWWGSIIVDEKEFTVTGTVDDPDKNEDGEHTLKFKVTVDELAEAASKVDGYVVGTGRKVSEFLLNQDIDADGGDQIMQRAIFGEVIYG